MISQGGCPSGNEQLIDEAIAEYLRAEAAGQAGDRQHWLDRYPACAESLMAFFDDRERIGELMMPVRISPQASPLAGGVTNIFTPARPVATGDTVDFGPEPPRLLSTRYRPLSFHARGGMGEIWLAEDERIGRRVAVKKLRVGRETQQARFVVEAQITGQLEHPSIVPLHDMGLDDAGHPFYVMKFIHGRRLNDAIAEFHAQKSVADWVEDLKFRRLLETFVSVCNVVAYAHHKGVVHRDIKPENVMLGPYGETLVVDWGLAKVIGQMDETRHSGVRLSGSGSTATQDGAIVGSPHYMSPEGAEGHPDAVDQSSDVYLLGATLYEILTASPPRRGTSSWELIDLALHCQPTSPRKLDPQIPRPLEAICMKAMAFDKQDRYETPTALAEDVEKYLAGAPIVAYREPLLARSRRWARRHRRSLMQALTALCMLILAGVAVDRYQRARLLAEREQARHDLTEFHRLADEAQYFAANTDAISERIPYYDPRHAMEAGEAALAIAAPWAKNAQRLPLTDERPTFLRSQSDLLLRMAQIELQGVPTQNALRHALALLDRAGAIQPPTRGYHQLRSQALALLGETKAAEAERVRASALETPVTAQDHFLAGEMLRLQDVGASAQMLGDAESTVHREHLAAAVEEYRQTLKIDPRHYWAHFQLGRCLLALGHASEAIEALSACVALRPTSPWAYSTRGLANAISDRPGEALSDLDQAVSLDPEFQPARLNRGVVHWLQHHHDEALADFAAVLESSEDRRLIEAAFYRGQILLEDQRDRDALADFSTVVAARPEFQPGYWFRAKTHFRLGDVDAGLADVRQFLALDRHQPKSDQPAELHLALGKALRNMAQQLTGTARTKPLLLAADELQAAIDAGSPTAEMWEQLGAVHELLQRNPDAIKAYSHGLALSTDSVRLRNMRGWAYVNERKYEAAQDDFAEALRVAPQNAEARAGLGFVLAGLGRDAEARQEASAALLAANDNHLVLHNVACIYARLSTKESERKIECENLALAALDRAVSISTEVAIGPDADELSLIRAEPSFPPSLRSRPEFQRLLVGKKRSR